MFWKENLFNGVEETSSGEISQEMDSQQDGQILLETCCEEIACSPVRGSPLASIICWHVWLKKNYIKNDAMLQYSKLDLSSPPTERICLIAAAARWDWETFVVSSWYSLFLLMTNPLQSLWSWLWMRIVLYLQPHLIGPNLGVKNGPSPLFSFFCGVAEKTAAVSCGRVCTERLYSEPLWHLTGLCSLPHISG